MRHGSNPAFLVDLRKVCKKEFLALKKNAQLVTEKQEEEAANGPQ